MAKQRWSAKVPWWATALAVGLCVGAMAVAAAFGPAPLPVGGLEVRAYDALFLEEAKYGPRVGRHDIPSDVVIIEFDGFYSPRSGRPTLQDDVQVYRTVLQAGAKAVTDTRMESGDAAVSLLEAIAEIDSAGRITREIWNASPEIKAHGDAFARHITHTGFDLFSGKELQLFTMQKHFAPLLFMADNGLEETAILKTARLALGIPRPTSTDDEARRAGILAAWTQDLAQMKTVLNPPLADNRAVAPTPYRMGDVQIPWLKQRTGVDSAPPALLWIDYSPTYKMFHRWSYADVLRGTIPAKEFEGKVVVIGNTPEFSAENYFLPSWPSLKSGPAWVLAFGIETLVRQRFLQPIPEWVSVIELMTLAMLGAFISARKWRIPSIVTLVLALVAYFVLGVAIGRSGRLADFAFAPFILVGAATIMGGIRLWREENERAYVTQLFGRYVAKRVVEDILKRPEAEVSKLGGVKKEITILFADVRGFTTYSDHFPPEQVVKELNSMLSIMVACAFDHEGTVDKYIGDAVLVLFNAPQDQADHALRAVRTAWAMQRALENHPSGLAFGIGIHTGEAVVGTVGTPERMEYTAIGGNVNLASRMCSSAGRGEVAISDAVQPLIAGEFETFARPPIRVKGIDRELTTFLVTAKK